MHDRVDRKAGLACQTPMSSLHSQKITTIEGVQGAEAQALKAAWIDLDVVQCGYCQSAQLMAACALLKQKPDLTDAKIRGDVQHRVPLRHVSEGKGGDDELWAREAAASA